MKNKLSFILFILILFLCTPCLSSWVVTTPVGTTINKVGDPIEINPESPGSLPTMPSICYYYDTSSKSYNYYHRIDSAIENNDGNYPIYIIPGMTIDIDYPITIPSGMTLIVPYGKAYTYNSTSKVYEWTDSPEAWNGTDDEIKAGTFSSFADSSTTNVNKYRSTLINMINGADITIESGGTLNLGGFFKTKGVSAYYSEINLDEESSITVKGTFNCYGYVKENTSTYKHANQTSNQSYYNNECDEGRYISVESTGHLTTALLVQDLSGGSELMNIINDGSVCPFNIMEFPNLQTFVEVKFGGKLDVQTRMEISDYFYNGPSAIVRTTSETALFKLSSGSVCFEYCPATTNGTTNGNAITRIYVNGALQQGNILIEPNSMVSINTANYFLPISYKFNIFVTSGNTYNTDYKMKFLPGAKVQINNGASLTLNSSAIFYNETSLSNVSGSGYPTTKGSSSFINNGTLTITSKGSIGGLIQTTQTDTSASIDFSVVSASALTVTSPEWSTPIVNVVVVSTGYFDDESSETGKSLYQFVAGSTVTSSSSGNQCWYGEKYAAYNLNINVLDMGYTYNVAQYQVYIADDSSGTNSTEVTSGITSTSGSYLIVKDKYFKVVLKRNKSATFSSGITESFVSDKWFRFNGETTLDIEPNEGVKISWSSTSISGASGTTYTFTECATKSGTFVEVGTEIYSGSMIIIKNYYFKIKCNGGTGTSGKLGIESIDVTSGPTELGTTIKENTAYQATGNIVLKFNLKACLLPSVLITLSNGNQVPVKDIKQGDELKVFNHETGLYDTAKVLFNDYEEPQLLNVVNLNFSNGKTIGVISEHGFFDLTTMKYEYIDENNVNNFVGHIFYAENGEEITLTSYNITQEYTECYSPVTEYHLNYFTEGVLSMPGGIEGLFNIFEYDDDLKYNQELMEKDIETYGLMSYEEFNGAITYEVYCMFPAKYFKVAMGKGLLTWEQLDYYINRYVPLL